MGGQEDGPGERGRLKPFTAFGGITLYAPSIADAVAEARANEESQVYFGRGAVTLREGASGRARRGAARSVRCCCGCGAPAVPSPPGRSAPCPRAP
jgi:hypothetical protein